MKLPKIGPHAELRQLRIMRSYRKYVVEAGFKAGRAGLPYEELLAFIRPKILNLRANTQETGSKMPGIRGM